MKKIVVILIMFILIIPLKIGALSGSRYYFIKTDEQGNFINDAEFKVHSLDGSIEYNVWKNVLGGKAPTPMSTIKLAIDDIAEDGQYYLFNSGEEDYNKLYNILSDDQKAVLEDLKDESKHAQYYELRDQTYSSDLERMQATHGIEFIMESNCVITEGPTPQVSDKNYNPTFMANEINGCMKLDIYVPVAMILEETKAPAGLKKEKAVMTFKYIITYDFDYDSSNNSYIYLGVSKVNYSVLGMYKYSHDINYSDVLNIYRKETILTNEDELYLKTDCGNYYVPETALITKAPTATNSIKEYKTSKMNNSQCFNYPVIIDHENGAVLTISSYVNNEGSTKASKGSELNYKVVVKNEGTTSSTNNVITSRIPEGFEYVEGSASDSGVYLESTNSVRWNIDEIGVESTKELTYKVSVSEDVDLTQAYISSATISNDGNDEIESNETRVILEGTITNPKTGDFNRIIILFVLCVAGFILYYIQDKKVLRGL